MKKKFEKFHIIDKEILKNSSFNFLEDGSCKKSRNEKLVTTIEAKLTTEKLTNKGTSKISPQKAKFKLTATPTKTIEIFEFDTCQT